MQIKKIELKQHYNHKLIYDYIPSNNELFGLDNIYISMKDYINKKNLLQQDFFDEPSFEKYDNVVCEGQTVFIGTRAKRFHFIGFAYWGGVNELFHVVYDDGTSDVFEITFEDWSRSCVKNLTEKILEYENVVEDVLSVVSSGAMIHPIYFHDSIYETKSDKKVEKIIFPNNIMIHIFALAIEY